MLSFLYSFLHHLSFSSVQHFVLPAISSLILFFNLLFYSLHFSMLIFSCLLLCLFQSPRFRLSAVLFCRKCSNSFFFLVLPSSSWFFFLHRYSLSYDTTMLHILFSVLQAIFLLFLFPSISLGSLNIIFLAFPCILSISFISSFFMLFYVFTCSEISSSIPVPVLTTIYFVLLKL